MGQHRPPPDWHALEERVLERLFRGDEEEDARGALVELGRRHDKGLRARAYRKCGGNADLSEEALQRLYTRLWEKRKDYNPDKGRWVTWARTILDRIIIDLFRERARSPAAPTRAPNDPDSSPGNWTDEIPGPEPSPDWRLELQELQQAMADCLGRLSPEEREALILQVLEGLSLAEVAERAQVPPATAGTRVYRARQKLRECLKRKGYEGGEV
jgi:RNA polymerase sigma-70 factor (ECF subfamily)